MSHVYQEIASQPVCWRRAIELAPTCATRLPAEGERVAVIGCGTSWFMAQAYAALRESCGAGETDAFAASAVPIGRRYDRVVAISRSGTTSEVLHALARLPRTPTVAIGTDPATPVMQAARETVVLEFADEQSVVQTRFATSALMLLRASLAVPVDAALADLDAALGWVIPTPVAQCEQFTFLGEGWCFGVASEAALKMREACGAWTEAYPTPEYRHGPISITGPDRLVWTFGPPADGLGGQIDRTGGMRIESGLDPLADLVRVQRLAVHLAEERGLDPDHPRHLSRSVILDLPERDVSRLIG